MPLVFNLTYCTVLPGASAYANTTYKCQWSLLLFNFMHRFRRSCFGMSSGLPASVFALSLLLLNMDVYSLLVLEMCNPRRCMHEVMWGGRARVRDGRETRLDATRAIAEWRKERKWRGEETEAMEWRVMPAACCLLLPSCSVCWSRGRAMRGSETNPSIQALLPAACCRLFCT